MQNDRFAGPSRQVANLLITNVAKASPETMNGSRGILPHKLVYAAAAVYEYLGVITRYEEVNYDRVLGFMFCQTCILTEAIENQVLYPFSDLDIVILNQSKKSFSELNRMMKEEWPAFAEMSEILN